MKLVIQIALGVFLGALASQLVMDSWRSYHEQQAKEAEREKLAADERAGNEQMQRARELLMRQLQGKAEEDPAPTRKFPKRAWVSKVAFTLLLP